MTFLQVVTSYPPSWQRGGPPRIMYDYARCLIADGHRVLVLTPDSNRPESGGRWGGFPEGLDVFYLKTTDSWRRRYHSHYSIGDIRRFFAEHWQTIDLIHLTQTRTLMNVVALHMARKYGIPIALSSFGSLPRRSGVGKSIYDRLFVYPLVKQASLLLGQTANECRTYADFGASPDAIKLLPLAVDVSMIPEASPSARASFRSRFRIPQDAHAVLFTGRLHPTKGLPFLFEAFAAARRRNPKLWLVIVGHDEGMLTELERLAGQLGIRDAISFCGPLYDAERWPAYQSCDSFAITPSIFEETSLASLEALACGTPVVTTAHADIPGLEQSGAGFVVAKDDQSGVVEAICRLADETGDRAMARREAARILASERFEISSVTKDLIGYANAVLQRQGTKTQ